MKFMFSISLELLQFNIYLKSWPLVSVIGVFAALQNIFPLWKQL